MRPRLDPSDWLLIVADAASGGGLLLCLSRREWTQALAFGCVLLVAEALMRMRARP